MKSLFKTFIFCLLVFFVENGSTYTFAFPKSGFKKIITGYRTFDQISHALMICLPKRIRVFVYVCGLSV